MNEERIRKEFDKMEIPDLKPEILAKLDEPKKTAPRRRVRPVLIAAALILLLTAAVGAASSGKIFLNPNNRIIVEDEQGNRLYPYGFTPGRAENIPLSANVPLSEQALANIAPYVFDPGPDQQATLFETADRAEMETLIDMPLILPEAVEKMATGYRLWATGTNGEAVHIHVQIQLNGSWSGDSVNVQLLGMLGTYITGSEPEFHEYTLPNGEIASLSVSETRSGTWTVYAFYTRDEAVYTLKIHGTENKKDALQKAKDLLDTLP